MTKLDPPAMLKQVIVALVMAVIAASMLGGSLQGPVCKPTGSLKRLTGLSEASGLAQSRIDPGRLWTHNDSGVPVLFALDAQGNVTGRVMVTGATLVDWEAIASAACGTGSCLYLADIGDNAGRRKEITIYRVPEPAAPGGSVQVDATFRASYPDGAHDAEALMVSPDGRLYIVTKGAPDQTGLYRFPEEPSPGAAMSLERVGGLLSVDKASRNPRVTDGAISPDGKWAVLRTHSALIFYIAPRFLSGQFQEAGRVELTSLAEPQGEAVAFGPSNAVYVAGEGGSKSQPGTLAALTCSK